MSNILKCFTRREFRSKHVSEVPIYINGKCVSVPTYYTILQALRRERVTIPSFCYHERLSVAGNCRMCLVQVEGMWKPQVSCAVQVMKNMKIRTNTIDNLKAQESVLEFLLVDHPLDCPICDQGGECDLQDLAMRFGNDRTRFTDIHFEGKRAVEDKDLGPFIRTEMTRCIHCTRCIRFAAQVCGLDVLGSTGRGGEMLVGTYVDKMFLSELSGNIIDLCPVGALTSIPYMFKARPWEITRTNSIDVTDATGTNITLNHRFNRLLRVLPRENDDINQEWLSDKGRWAIDSYEMQRLVTPMMRIGGNLRSIEWNVVLTHIGGILKRNDPLKIMAIAGPLCNVETLVVAKDLLNILGSDRTYVERDFNYGIFGSDIRAGYSLNIRMKDIAKADKILLVGTNPRFEAPVLNAWIRQAYRNNECDIYVVGPTCEYNYNVTYIGKSMDDLQHAQECLKDAKYPLIFVGVDQLGTPNAPKLMSYLSKIAANKKRSQDSVDWVVLNIITKEASFAGALECGWKSGALAALESDPPCILISLGADYIFCKWEPPKECTVIYVGFQGDIGAESATIVLPGSAHIESGGTFLNMECRTQFALPAITPPGQARTDWKIFRAIAEYSRVRMFYSDISSLCCRLTQISPNLTNYGLYQNRAFTDMIPRLINEKVSNDCKEIEVHMKTLEDYYCSDIFTYNSPSMVKAKKAAKDFHESPYARVI